MGAAGRHHAPLTRQSFSILSIADEVDLGKAKRVCGVYYEKNPLSPLHHVRRQALVRPRGDFPKTFPLNVSGL